MKEEIIIINGEPFYRIPNGTSCDYAPIPKQFKPYFEKLEEKNKSLQSQLKEKEKEEENEQLKADYGNLAQVERDFLKEVIKEIIEYLQSKEFKENFPYVANECQVRSGILNIVDKERTNDSKRND